MANYRGYKNKYGYDVDTSKPLGSGGEGVIYSIAGQDKLVAKIYHPQQRSDTRRRKLEAMAMQPGAEQFKFIAWPIDVIYDSTGFCGFVMQKFTGRQDLGLVLSDINLSWEERLIIAYNLCDVVKEIHDLGKPAGEKNPKKYGQCIGDMNPQNFGIDCTLSCCAFDADSFRYEEKNLAGNINTYRCSVGIGHYLAPEIQAALTTGGDLSTIPVSRSFSKETDLFTLAVLIFQLMFLGFHPFQAMRLPQQGSSVVVNKREINILYKMSPYFNPSSGITIPKASPGLNILPQSTQAMFRAALIDEKDSRPTAEQWQLEIAKLGNSLKICNMNSNHKYWSGCSKCPWCGLANQNKKPVNIPQTVDGADYTISLELTSSEVKNGCKKILTDGKGNAFEGTFPQNTVVTNGEATIVFSGRGYAGKNGGKDGDMYVKIKVSKNKVKKIIKGIVFGICLLYVLGVLINAIDKKSNPSTDLLHNNIDTTAPKHSPYPTPIQTYQPTLVTPYPEAQITTYSSKQYTELRELPGSATDEDVYQIAQDWISFPPTDMDVYPIKKEITIKAGEKTRLELFRNEKGEAGTFDCVWYFSDANVTFDWAGGGTGWSGHTLIGYITADKPCTIFAYFESESGKIAHMVVYVK